MFGTGACSVCQSRHRVQSSVTGTNRGRSRLRELLPPTYVLEKLGTSGIICGSRFKQRVQPLSSATAAIDTVVSCLPTSRKIPIYIATTQALTILPSRLRSISDVRHYDSARLFCRNLLLARPALHRRSSQPEHPEGMTRYRVVSYVERCAILASISWDPWSWPWNHGSGCPSLPFFPSARKML